MLTKTDAESIMFLSNNGLARSLTQGGDFPVVRAHSTQGSILWKGRGGFTPNFAKYSKMPEIVIYL